MANTMPFWRYSPIVTVDLPDRTWPSNVTTKAPIWCSVDLRDGNQALIEPMGAEKKLRMFKMLMKMGFKEIEVGFPAASDTDFGFIRMLIERDLIPKDVTIQVLTQARKELIDRTFEAVDGARRVIVHLYNPTSTLQRRVVFGLSEGAIVQMACDATLYIQELARKNDATKWVLEYSPESFTGTELPFAARICNAVARVWQPTPAQKMIINLPATVEMATPNVYADMIEWMCRNLTLRDSIAVSVHTHNDCGTAIAATELALLAGADRVEGTLFGNGERTGNVDIVTLACNMMARNVNPRLYIHDISEIVQVAEDCTQIPVHPRAPYAGELVFTACSGGHQDAVKKGLDAIRASGSDIWEVPYLLIDPGDIGRNYQPIRINSQSGKGGIAFVMRERHGLDLPRGPLIDFSAIVQKEADRTGKELLPEDLWRLFEGSYLRDDGYVQLCGQHDSKPSSEIAGGREVSATVRIGDNGVRIHGHGNGDLDAFVRALNQALVQQFTVHGYSENALGSGSDAKAAAYVSIHVPEHQPVWGVGIHTDIPSASFKAVISAINRIVVMA